MRRELLSLHLSLGTLLTPALLTLTLSACTGGNQGLPAVTTPPALTVPPVAVQPVPVQPVPVPVISPPLKVTGGISAVSQTPGAALDVFATADPAGMVFDRWVGDTAVLLTPGERRSGAASTSAGQSVRATYRPLAEFTPITAVLNGLPATNSAAVNAYWSFPRALPTGVIFRLHGKGGNAQTQFTKTEERKFARDAVADGFAVVLLDSTDRVNKSWDATTDPGNPAANADVRNIQQLIARFKTQGLMNDVTPVFASGMSAGAGAALRFAYLLHWKAIHQACVPGTLQIAQTTTVPGIWTMAQNDTREEPTRDADALTNSNALAARGIATQYVLVAPSAVYPARFAQIASITEADSQLIYATLRLAGLLDANDFQTTDPNDVANLAAIIPAAYTAFAAEIGNQLNVAYTAHQFSAATNRRVLDFFKARL